jgi:hypothetical protein
MPNTPPNDSMDVDNPAQLAPASLQTPASGDPTAAARYNGTLQAIKNYERKVAAYKARLSFSLDVPNKGSFSHSSIIKAEFPVFEP